MAKTAIAEPVGREIPLGRTAKLMARAMSAAWQAPMFDIVVEMDMAGALARRGDGVTVTDVLISDVARTLKEDATLNAHFRDDTVIRYDEVNIGLAVASDRGLTVPVIRGADTLSLSEIAETRRSLVDKVRAGRIAIADVTGATFTISNLGMFDVTQFTAILNPPQVGILAVGRTNHRYVWNDGTPDWRQIAEMTLTSDHRAVDGTGAAGFMARLRDRLQRGGPD